MEETLNRTNNPALPTEPERTEVQAAAEQAETQAEVQPETQPEMQAAEQPEEQLPTVYKFRFDRRTWYLSAAYLLVYAVLGVLLYLLYEGGFMSAWFTSFVAALAALMALSIPTKLVVTARTVEIRCLCDFTELQRDEIASVEAVPNDELKWHIPLLGGYGFFGYYGHYMDLRRFERVKIYASEWRNFVRITDIYDDSIIISCRDAQALIAQLGKPAKAAETETETETEAGTDSETGSESETGTEN